MKIRFWRKPALPEERRQALERWVRLRFQLVDDDPMVAIIGAVARLTDEGMEHEAAIEAVLKILRQEEEPVRQ
jgi:hypothetical protein